MKKPNCITIRVEEWLAEKIIADSEKHDRSIAWVVRQALTSVYAPVPQHKVIAPHSPKSGAPQGK